MQRLSERPRRVAIIGCGAAGLSAAYGLTRAPAGSLDRSAPAVALTLYETRETMGGHADTAEVRPS